MKSPQTAATAPTTASTRPPHCRGGSVLVLALFAAHLLMTTGQAQPFAIDWHTVDGGGGSSTGGVFTLTGTIGQPDSGVATGGSFLLTGGLWILPVAVQNTNGPTLYIVPAIPGTATVFWDPTSPGFVLQSSPSLDPPDWSPAPSGTNNPAAIPALGPARFYRLLKP